MSKRLHHRAFVAGFILASLLGWGGSLSAQTTPIGFSLSNASITEKDTFEIALSADSILTGRSVYAYRFYITYSPTYFEFLSMEGTGSILSDWGIPVLNSSNAGTLVMAGAGTEPLSGSGEMIYLKFRSLRSGNAYISFNTTESYLNERNPPSIFTNGYIVAAARSYPNIYPDQAQMFIGAEVQMSVSGGEAPFIYSVSNPLVAQINDGSRVRAIGPGTTRVTVTDANGETSSTTGLFDVRAIRMDLEEVGVWPSDSFYIPVKLEVAPGTTVYSGRFELAHSTGLSGLPGDILQGDFPVMIENNTKTGRMTVSFASSSGITGNGVLCYLYFRANTSGNQNVHFENMRFNEILLAWTVKSNYYINVYSLPTLNMVPNSGTLMWGETLKINVYNGTAPYTWSVSDPSLASINSQGNLTAITGGEVRVTATDANGATVTSGWFTISDHQVSVYPADGILDTDTRVPVISSSLPSGKAIFGFKAGFSFDGNYLEFVRAEPAGGSGLVQAVLTGTNIEVAGAFSQGVGSGIIGYLVFRIRNTLPINSSTPVNITSFSGNENSLYSVRLNGSVRRMEQVSYRPVAIAGLDFSIQEGNNGQLDGTASFDLDNDPLTYYWSTPEGFILNDPASATPGFIAPYVSENTVYTMSLVVSDGTDESDPDEVSVTVLQVNLKPVADAGADAGYVEGSSVSLDGGNSYDPDGDMLSYSWTSLDGIVLFNPTSLEPSFILPQVSESRTYRFTLVVNDGAMSSARDTVRITAINVNKKPVAYAGGDFSLDEKEEGQLDGTLSYDLDNDPLTYRWTPPAGINLSSPTVPDPTFTAPAVHRDSVLQFTLVVNDGIRDSDPDVVRATIVNLDSLSRETLIDSVYMTALDSFAIDTTLAIVTLFLPYGLDVRAIAPGFTLSRAASVSPASGSVHDFSMSFYYRVTAEDGVTSRLWRVEVYRPEREVQRALNAGWNWISLNVQPPDATIGTLFGGLSLADRDYIKSAEYSAIYYDATGWFGNLNAFPQNRMVKLKKSIAEELVIEGLEINPAITFIPLVKGWNDIAYLLKSDRDIDAALVTASIPAGDVLLKGLGGSAVYYAGSGWAGELETLQVLHGYKIHVQSAGSLMYNPSGISKKSISTEGQSHESLMKEYGLQPERFEYSSTLIAEAVNEEGESLTESGSVITACHGDEIRGVSGAIFIPAIGKYLFILTYYSNDEAQEIRFRLNSPSDNSEYESGLFISFRPDDITGDAYNPYRMVISGINRVRDGKDDPWISVYPNPVSESMTVNAAEPIKKMRLFDLTGKMILACTPAGQTYTVPTERLEPGIYTLEVETANGISVRKVIKTSR
ncbi:MAG: T9SS type A sorting domain-containing protein [Bacteroidales bacterium]|nr:T9SS type A sorting domain-containing protein [Bacteroidales bacterium]